MGELAVFNQESRLEKSIPVMEFSSEQIRILQETVAKGCDQNELGFFLNVCRMKRLDPFSAQIHVVKRWDKDTGREKMAIQIGIDGFRVIAARTNDLAGIEDAVYDSEEGAFPKWAKVTVNRYGRENEKIPYTATARWSEYVQTKQDGSPTRNWATKPYLMLGKCAEALALRKGFPDELSGMYTDEEMGQADNHHPGQPDHKPPVSMPQSTKQTQQAKAEPVRQEQPKQDPATQAENAGPIKRQVTGTVEKVRLTDKGEMWLTVDGTVVAIRKDKVPEKIEAGYRIIVDTIQKAFKDKSLFFETQEIVTLMAPGDVEEGEIVSEEPVVSAADAALAGELKGMFDESPKAQPAEPQKTTVAGKIGTKRAQRLYTIVSQNHKNTGFTEAVLREMMKLWYHPIEHLSDLDTGSYEQFEKWATGEEDFQPVLEGLRGE